MSEFSMPAERNKGALSAEGMAALQTKFASGVQLTADEGAMVGAYPELFSIPEQRTELIANDPDFEGDSMHHSEGTK